MPVADDCRLICKFTNHRRIPGKTVRRKVAVGRRRQMRRPGIAARDLWFKHANRPAITFRRHEVYNRPMNSKPADTSNGSIG